MNRDERRAVLAELRLRLDLSEVPVETLAAAVREAKTEEAALREFVGKAVAAMHHAGLTFAEIAKLTELPHSSLHFWARPYL